MRVRFLTFEMFHGKQNIGSTFIRVHQLIKKWSSVDSTDDVGIYKFGENPDVLIFQKVYCSPDYKFPAHFKGIKILDACDPDWINGVTSIKETVDAMDAVVCSSDNLATFMRQLTDKPVLTIKDRFDLDTLPKPRVHSKKAKSVLWYGYRHNAETLKPAMKKIYELGLNLIIVADDDPMAWQWLPRQEAEEFRRTKYTFIKYDEEKMYENMQTADFCVLPVGNRPIDIFKSNNKTTKAVLAGLPVAKDAESLEQFIDPKERNKYLEENYQLTRGEYDVRKSVEEYKQLIDLIKNTASSKV